MAPETVIESMTRCLVLVIFLFANTITATPAKLHLDRSEAEQVLAILRKGETATETDWQNLFATDPCVRLEKRDASMGRAFTEMSSASACSPPSSATSARR